MRMTDSDLEHPIDTGSKRDAASNAGEVTSSVPLAMLLAYASPMLAVNFSLVLFMSYINKYAIDELLVPPVAMGILFGIGRLWDAVTDPLAGVWSDRTNHRWGRRRPWLAASAIPIALFGVMVWVPPATLGTTALIAWMAVAILGFNSAMTIFLTPHQALGAELTLDHHAVSRIFAVRQAAGYFAMVGSLVFAMPYLMTASDPIGSATKIAVVSGIAVVVLIAISVAVLREPAENRRRGGKNASGVARDVWKNRYARRLFIMIFIEHAGSGASMVLAPFLMQYVVGLPGKIGHVFVFYVGSSLLSLGFWLWLSRRIGKKRAWLVGLVTGMLGYFALFFVGEGDLRWMQMVVTLTGAASACGTVLGSSILADVIDADELATGERKEGAYYSAYTFLFKSSSGVMAMVTGLALAWVGYEANAPHQTQATQLAIRSLNGLVPLASFAIGAFILAGFELTEETHTSIRAQLDEKRAQGGGVDSSG